nr:MAG: hypothetical protein [Bacteriophage sp.]UWF93113.1 MAG: hypothetical protein [Bacteriophage sp.]
MILATAMLWIVGITIVMLFMHGSDPRR